MTTAEAARLEKNCPNPFNSDTCIAFEIQKAQRVRLEVFDLQRRRVRILVDGVGARYSRPRITRLLARHGIRCAEFLASKLIEAGTAAVRMDPGLDPIAAAGTLRKAFATGLNKYQLPVSGVTKNGNAVLVLDPGAEPILDYFRGIGPPPPIEP